MDGLGELPGAPRTAAELSEDSPGLELSGIEASTRELYRQRFLPLETSATQNLLSRNCLMSGFFWNFAAIRYLINRSPTGIEQELIRLTQVINGP